MGAETQKELVDLTDKKGCEYTGQVVNDLPHGNGSMKCEARNIAYWGEWKEGTFNGKGRYFWENGWYEGQFKNGFLEGEGVRFVRGENQHCIFTGAFANNALEGEGKETCIDNEYFNTESAIINQHVTKGKRGKHQVYSGQYSKGLYNGYG